MPDSFFRAAQNAMPRELIWIALVSVGSVIFGKISYDHSLVCINLPFK